MGYWLSFALVLTSLALVARIQGIKVSEDIDIVIYSGPNRTQRREVVSVGTCLNVDDREDEYRLRVPVIQSIDSLGECLQLWQYDCCRGISLQVHSDQGNLVSNLSEKSKSEDGQSEFLVRSISRCDQEPLPSPVTLQDLFVNPEDRRSLDTPVNVKAFDSKHAAIYIDFPQPTDSRVDWIYRFVTLGWAYVKHTFGKDSFGKEQKLYAIFHLKQSEGQGQRSGQEVKDSFTPASGLHSKSLCRDMFTYTLDKEDESIEVMDKIAQVMSELVESGYGGVIGSPSYNWTGNAGGSFAFADLFRYDLYKNLGMDNHADRIYNSTANKRSTVRSTRWFRNWLWPIYEKHGGINVTVNFLRLRNKYFDQQDVTRPSGLRRTFSRFMNLGELIHFYSGAARKNLSELARRAFRGYDWKPQFDKAGEVFDEILDLYSS